MWAVCRYLTVRKDFFYRIVLSVLGNANDGKMLDVAARNFTFGEVATVMQLAARFSGDLDGIVAELQKSLIFRFGYDIYRKN